MNLLSTFGSSPAPSSSSHSSVSTVFTNNNNTLVVVVKQYQNEPLLLHHHNHHHTAAVLLPFTTNLTASTVLASTSATTTTTEGTWSANHFADGPIILFHGATEWCPNVTNAVVWPSCVTLAEALALALFLFVVMLVIVLGNLMVVLTVSNDTKMRSQRQNWLLVSLAVADLLVGLLVMPLTLIYEIVGIWMLGSVLCELWLALDVLFVTASILHMCIISLDRYWSVTQPLSYPAKRTPKRISIMIGVAWMVSLLICFPPLLGWRPKRRPGECAVSSELDYVLYSSLGSFYIPVAILVVVYMRIYMITKRHSQQRLKDTQRMGQTLCQMTGGGGGANANKTVPTDKRVMSHRVAEVGAGGIGRLDHKRQIKFCRSIPLSADDKSSTDPSTSVWPIPAPVATVGAKERRPHEHLQPNGMPATTATTTATASTTRENGVTQHNKSEQYQNQQQQLDNNIVRNGTKTAAKNGNVFGGVNNDCSKQYQHQQQRTMDMTKELQSNDDSNESAATTTVAFDEQQQQQHNQQQQDEELEEDRTRQLLREHCFKPPYKGTVGPPSKKRFTLFSRLLRKGCTDDSTAQIVRIRSLEKRKRRLKAKERQATLLLGLILFAFIFSWMPFFIIYVLNALHIYAPVVVFKFFFWLGYCNSAINPIIYTYFNREFRRALLRLIRRNQHRFHFLERFSQHEP